MTQTESIPVRNLASRRPRGSLPVDASPADAASVGIARLNKHGEFTYVNSAWRSLLEGTQLHGLGQVELGTSLAAVCDASATRTWSHDLAVAVGEMSRGDCDSFELAYSAHSFSELRWLRLHGRWQVGKRSIVVTCVDCTSYRIALARSRIQASVAESFAASTRLLAACRNLGTIIANELAWDWVAVWVPDPTTLRLRCRELWTRGSLDLKGFDSGVRSALLRRGQGMPGRVWSSQRAEWWSTRDDAAPERDKLPKAALGAGFHSGLAFAVKHEGEVLAVIELYSRMAQSPDASFITLLETAGARLATAELRARKEVARAQLQLEANTERDQLATALACVQALVIAVARDGTVCFVNRPLLATVIPGTGMNKWHQYVPPAASEAIEQALQAVLAGGPAQKQDIAVPGPNGTSNWLSYHLRALHNEAGISGALLVVQDVSQTKHAQHELFEAQRMAALGTMAAGIAHEINTPVQFVGDSLEFLRDATHDTRRLIAAFQELRNAIERHSTHEQLEELVKIANNAEEHADLEYLQERVPRAFERCADGLSRVTSIVRSMKEFSHPAHKDMAPADLNRAVEATLTVARNEYKYVADLELDLGDLPPVCCHVNEINQVVLNIIVNAAHAIGDRVRGTTDKGKITVRTSLQGELAEIAISDTGGGIPEGIRDRIFEPFFTTKEVGRGTGQGLALAWRTVKERHGGELSFESSVGVGTTFYIRLPVAGQCEKEAS